MVHNGVELGLAVVDIADGKASISPFIGESHSTSAVDSLTLTTDADGSILNIEIISN